MPLKLESSSRPERSQPQHSPECDPSSDLTGIEPGLPTGKPKPLKRKRAAQNEIPVRRRRKLTRLNHNWLNKPIAYQSWQKAKELALFKEGSEIGELEKELALIRHGKSAFIPEAVKDKIKRGQFGFNHFTNLDLLDDPRPSDMIQHEFIELGWILKSQDSLAGTFGNESTWHAQVWTRILYCAVDLQVNPRTSWESVATAQIGRPYLPYVGSPSDQLNDRIPDTSRDRPRRTVQSKVDYVVTLIPTTAAQQAISKVIDTRAEAGLPATINHASGLDLRYQPIAISMASRTGKWNSAERLGIWSAAWFESIAPLVSQSSLTKEEKSLAWIPLITIDWERWSLSFAINDVISNQIIVTESVVELGNTRTTVEAYKLLASLRVLLKWADGTYRARWDKMLGIATST